MVHFLGWTVLKEPFSLNMLFKNHCEIYYKFQNERMEVYNSVVNMTGAHTISDIYFFFFLFFSSLGNIIFVFKNSN